MVLRGNQKDISNFEKHPFFLFPSVGVEGNRFHDWTSLI